MPNNAKPVFPAAAGHPNDQAVGHLPEDHFVFTTSNTGTSSLASQALDHVPPQAEAHVPSEVPPPVPCRSRRYTCRRPPPRICPATSIGSCERCRRVDLLSRGLELTLKQALEFKSITA